MEQTICDLAPIVVYPDFSSGETNSGNNVDSDGKVVLQILNNSLTANTLFKGNFSETFWRANSAHVLRKYNYSDDNLNQLPSAG